MTSNQRSPGTHPWLSNVASLCREGEHAVENVGCSGTGCEKVLLGFEFVLGDYDSRSSALLGIGWSQEAMVICDLVS